MVAVTFHLVGGKRGTLEIDLPCTGARIHEAAAALYGPPTSLQQPYKIVLGGKVLLDAEADVKLASGDVLLVAHPRKVPSALLVSAVVGGDDTGGEESDPKVRLPPDAAAWEHAAVRAVKERLKAPEWVVDWVILLRPYRLLLLACFPFACVLASHLSLGPIFILAAIITVIFTNLGQRKEGEASAYSVFNEGRRLPGQLDADVVDEQIRRGQM